MARPPVDGGEGSITDSGEEDDLPSDLLRRIAAAPPVDLPVVSELSLPDLAIGTIIDDHLRIDDRLGTGGMGVVYRARDLRLNRDVAVKIHHATNRDGVDRLLREAKALARLSHPNVVTVHEVGTTGNRLFMVMELAEGGNVKDWVASTRPTTAEIVAAFIDAGRGLAAAHSAGLIHRDFKPENILVGSDGVFRVGDFGLVTAAGDPTCFTSSNPDLPIGGCTLPGTVMGTLAYMAPEQHAGDEIDARADQFSFCVALCETLAGARPFRGRSQPEIVAAILAGEIAVDAAEPAIPRRIMRILRRGLRPDPDQRYPDMARLLADLERDPARTARRWAIAALAAVAIAGGAAIAGSRYTRRDPCPGTGAEMALSWSRQAPAVDAAFRATGLPYAETTLTTVSQFLTNCDTRLRAAAVTACRETRIDGLQSERALDLRTACLRNWRDHADALIQLFATADAAVVEKAVRALASLPALDRCDHVEVLLNGVAPPPEAQSTEIAAISQMVARARALTTLGKLAEARAVTEGLIERARATDYLPVLAEALWLVGSIAQSSGDQPGAEQILTDAYFTARRAHHQEIAMRAANQLVFAVGSDPVRYAEAELWTRHAETERDQAFRGTEWEARIPINRAAIAEAAGKYQEAHNLYREAFGRLGDQPSAEKAQVLDGLGSTLHAMGRLAEAASFYQQSIAMIERLLGAEHPDITYGLSNLGLLEADRGNYDQAAEHLRRVVAIDERVFGADNVNTAYAILNLGVALHGKQDYPDALAAYRRALAIIEAKLGADHADAALCLNSLAVTLAAMGDTQAALDHYQRAMAIVERLGEHPQVAQIATNIAEILQSERRFEETMPYLTRALDIWEHTAPNSFRMVQALTCYGISLVELRRPAPALAALERADKLAGSEEIAGDQRARTHFALARAYRLADRNCRRAAETARVAAAGYDRAGRSPAEAARVRDWLARNCPASRP